jgi:hypothetical protein
MNAMIKFIVASIGICFAATPLLSADFTNLLRASIRPDLEYLKAVNKAAPPRDPQLLFLLMGSMPAPTGRPKVRSFSPPG